MKASIIPALLRALCQLLRQPIWLAQKWTVTRTTLFNDIKRIRGGLLRSCNHTFLPLQGNSVVFLAEYVSTWDSLPRRSCKGGCKRGIGMLFQGSNMNLCL